MAIYDFFNGRLYSVHSKLIQDNFKIPIKISYFFFYSLSQVRVCGPNHASLSDNFSRCLFKKPFAHFRPGILFVNLTSLFPLRSIKAFAIIRISKLVSGKPNLDAVIIPFTNNVSSVGLPGLRPFLALNFL
jgi:hypothetical protein